MSYSYNRTAGVDASVLGYTEAEIRDMDDEERQEVFAELYHRALDLVSEVVEGFGPYKNQGVGERQLDSLGKAAKLLKATRP